jgi:translation initiation factor 2B subunit (eIF-2B alpha/beta/delta family)/8-oxo-dGTP pyrophosphatase MutT (NUDIX family)
MQLRHVVTCFLLHPAEQTVLLGRRGPNVSTYPGRWAAVSGSVEADTPLEQAYREIEEETGLGRAQVRLRAQGRAVRFPDWELAVLWVVHPFLFDCAAPDEVRRDWEHAEFRWQDPRGISELDTVPRLAEAYASAVGAEEGAGAERVFRQVREDRDHGAEELGIWTLEGLRQAALDLPDGAPGDWLAAMQDACREALSLRPSMASVRSAALGAFEACRDALGSGAAKPDRERLAAGIGALIARRQSAPLQSAAAARGLLPDGARVVTLSRSFTVLCLLRDAADRVGRLTVAESRPACEGRETARRAASFGVTTELVTDAAAAGAVAGADLLVFGADSICADGSAVNKVGTLALCAVARRRGVRTLCVTSRSKLLPAGFEPAMEEMAPEELGDPVPGVSMRNPCFERVPAGLVSRVVVAGGEMERSWRRRRARQLAELQRALGAGD